MPLHLCLLLLLFLPGAIRAADTMEVSDAWVREAPPVSRVLAAYMQIRNLTGADFTIVEVSSPDFASAQLHRTVLEDGIARMLPVDQLTVPAGGSVAMEPGGLHLMLYEPSRPLPQGDSVTLILHRSDGICYTLPAPVRAGTGDEHLHQHH